MAEFPAFPLWTDAYLADTSHLTTAEHGAYLLLLMAMWRAGGTLPHEDRLLARFARLSLPNWRRMRATVMTFFTVSQDGEHLTQGRLSDELTYVRAQSQRQSDRIRTRWDRVKSEAKLLADNDVDHSAVLPEPYRGDTPTPTPTPIPREEPSGSLSETVVSNVSKPRLKKPYPAAFEEAWKAYPTDSNMSKADAFKAWGKLDEADRVMLAASLPNYRAYCRARPDYRAKHMDGYIRSRRFEGHAGGGAGVAAPAEDWAKRLGNAREKGWWSTTSWGPTPGVPGCRAPVELLRPGDGEGWREWVPGRAET